MAPDSVPVRQPDRATVVDEATFRSWQHPKEARYLPFALIGVGAIAILGLVLLVVTFGALLLVVAGAVATLWWTGRIVEARLRGNAIEVSEHHFPEIAERVERIRLHLGYDKSVEAWVWQDGEINALLWRVFGRRYLGFNSGLVESMTPAEQEFVIARFIGALRSKHLRFHEAASLIGGLEKLWGLNILLLPYLRATVLSGDRVGFQVCGDADAAIRSLDKFTLGKGLAERINDDGMFEQGRRLDSRPISKAVANMWSSHPFMVDRYRELVTYARQQAEEPVVAAPVPASAAFLPPPSTPVKS